MNSLHVTGDPEAAFRWFRTPLQPPAPTGVRGPGVLLGGMRTGARHLSAPKYR